MVGISHTHQTKRVPGCDERRSGDARKRKFALLLVAGGPVTRSECFDTASSKWASTTAQLTFPRPFLLGLWGLGTWPHNNKAVLLTG